MRWIGNYSPGIMTKYYNFCNQYFSFEFYFKSNSVVWTIMDFFKRVWFHHFCLRSIPNSYWRGKYMKNRCAHHVFASVMGICLFRNGTFGSNPAAWLSNNNNKESPHTRNVHTPNFQSKSVAVWNNKPKEHGFIIKSLWLAIKSIICIRISGNFSPLFKKNMKRQFLSIF